MQQTEQAAPNLDERVRAAVHDALHALPTAQFTSINTVVGVVAGAALAEVHRVVPASAATRATGSAQTPDELRERAETDTLTTHPTDQTTEA